ncbi:hypothetical protein BHE74_00005695 [Ensete ventricosum]|nr:hypothetical protein GW17_00009142 [Ensete ventricosum]RWW85603.1 hypothetical protein BHE74_00005695 [Ensete ventricosum]
MYDSRDTYPSRSSLMSSIPCTSTLPFITTARYHHVAVASPSMKGNDAELAMEITVISAQGLKNPSSPLLPGRRLRPFAALFYSPDCDRLPSSLHRTRVDEQGARNPDWGDTVRLPLDSSFSSVGASSTNRVPVTPTGAAGGEDGAAVYIVVLSKQTLAGPARLGWCRIPPADILDGFRSPSDLRRLSYALRSPRHGGRGHGVIHVTVRLLGRGLDRLPSPPPPGKPMEEPGWCRLAIGIPVAVPPAAFPPPRWTCSRGPDCVQGGRFAESARPVPTGLTVSPVAASPKDAWLLVSALTSSGNA